MKYVNLFLVSLLLLFPVSAFSQSSIYDQLQIHKQDIEKLNQRLFDKLKKDTLLSSVEDFEFVHVYWLSLNGLYPEITITKEDLLSGEYVKKVIPNFHPYKKNFFKKDSVLSTLNSIMIDKATGELVARGKASFFMSYGPFEQGYLLKSDEKFVELIQSKDFVILFSLFWAHPFFALTKDNELFVIQENKEREWEIISLEYFIDHYYDCWWVPWECNNTKKNENKE